jgi:glycosyltransferase involved in cell wall biosynthesis
LKFAEKLVHIIFTSTATGCRINSKKIKVIGQGIDVEKFKPLESRDLLLNYFKILSVGRISPIKDYETLIEAIDILVNKKSKEKIQVDIIGAPAFSSQEKYLKRLKEIIIKKKLENVVRFLGPVPNRDIVGFLQDADIFVNTSHTGSLDKAIVEAMACGLPILTCNEALESVLGDLAKMLIYPKKDSVKLAEKIGWLAGLGEKERRDLGEKLRFIAVRDHSLENFVKKIKQSLLSV